MQGFFRRYQKWMMAVFGVFLMIAWSATGFVGNNSARDRVLGRTVGTLGGTKVTAAEVEAARQSWSLLSTLQYTSPDLPPEMAMQRIPLGAAILQNGRAAGQFNQNPEAFFLLLSEAKRQGIAVDNDRLQTVLANNIATPIEDEARKAQVAQAVGDGLRVRGLLDRVGNTVKVSRPARARALAISEQEVSVRAAQYRAADHLDKVPPPTAQQVQAQYDAHKDELPGQYDAAENPLGFGYKLPDRVAFDALSMTKPALLDAAKASRDELSWATDAFGEFRANRAAYDAMTLPPSTQPSTQPTTQAAAQPTTRRADDAGEDFILHKSLVLDALYEKAAAKLRTDVLKKLSDTMTADFVAYGNATRGKTAAPASSVGPAYDSGDYLPALAAAVQKQFGVALAPLRAEAPRSAEDLAGATDLKIAKATLPMQSRGLAFADYALRLAEPLMTDEVKKSPLASMKLALYQPSQPLSDAEETDYIFRLTRIDPAHVAPFDDARAKAEQDVRLNAAYAAALADAKAVLDRAKTTGLALAAGEQPLVTTMPFRLSVSRDPSARVVPLSVKSGSARLFAAASFKLLELPGGERRVGLAEMYPDATVAVIELGQATPLWTAAEAAQTQAQAAMQLVRQDAQQLESAWCDYDAAKARLDWKPAAGEKAGG